MSEWIAVEKTATGPNGEKMAVVDGTWQPADGTATGPQGEKMARLKAAATPVPAKSESGVGETPVPAAAGAAGEAPQMNQQLPEPPPVLPVEVLLRSKTASKYHLEQIAPV